MKLHSFAEAVDHLESGGSVRRYGGPEWYLCRYWPHQLLKTSQCGRYATGAQFSVEDQQSSDWLLKPIKSTGGEGNAV